MRGGGRGEAKSRRHVARRSHGDVVRVGHGCTSQLTLGRSPDCLVAGRRADLSEGVGKQQVAVLVDGHSVGLPFRLNRRSRALAIDRAACPSSALWAPSPRGGRIRWLSIRWGRPNVGSYASVYAIGHRPPSHARAAVSNIQDHIAGAGDGTMANWGVRAVSVASISISKVPGRCRGGSPAVQPLNPVQISSRAIRLRIERGDSAVCWPGWPCGRIRRRRTARGL